MLIFIISLLRRLSPLQLHLDPLELQYSHRDSMDSAELQEPIGRERGGDKVSHLVSLIELPLKRIENILSKLGFLLESKSSSSGKNEGKVGRWK